MFTINVEAGKRPEISRMKARVDLDGDGKVENIIFASFGMREGQSSSTFVLRIHGNMGVYDGDNLLGNFKIVDIDTTDSLKEIAVPEEGPSDDHRVYYLRYYDSKITMIGSIPSSLRASQTIIDGSGIIRARTRSDIIDTWWYLGVYYFSDETCSIEELPQAEYEYGRRVTLLVDLPLYVDETMTTLRCIVKKNEHGTISKTDNKSWCYFEGEGGVRGYFPVNGSKVLHLDKRSSDVFGGLRFAD
jgi:hypothetical protein